MPEAERVALSIELLKAVLRHNHELLQELQFKVGMSRFERAQPLVRQISLTESFELVADLPPTEEAVAAIKAVIDAVRGFLEVFVCEAEASRRLLEPAAEFLKEHRDALVVHHMDDVFPFLAAQELGKDRAGEVRKLEEREQVIRIFEALYTRYLSSAKAEQAAVYMHKLRACLRDKVEVQEVEGEVSISLSEGVDANSAMRLLSLGLDAMVELTETYFGRPHAFEEAARHLGPVFLEFGEVPEALGINDYVLRGALASNIRFGIQPLDDAMRGGLERATSTLLCGTAGWARDTLVAQFVQEGLEMGGSVLLVTTSMPVQRIEEILSSFGVRCRDAMKSGRLAIVDYNICHRQSVHGVERQGMIFRCSTDLTNLGIAVGMALDALRGTGAKRAVLDILSPAAALFGSETTLDFSMMLKVRFERADVTSLFLMGKEQKVRWLQGVFDNLLVLDEDEESTALRILTLSKPVFDPSPMKMRCSEEGIVVQPAQGSLCLIQREDRRERVASGTQGLDLVCGAGLPKPGAVLVEVPPGEVRDAFVRQFLREALSRKDGVLLLSSTRKPSSVLGDVAAGAGVRSRVAAIDWYSCRERHVVGVERDHGILIPSLDLTNLGIAVDMALRELAVHPEISAVVEVLSSALRDYALPEAFRFLVSITGKLSGAISIFLMDSAQEEGVRALVCELFDAHIQIQVGRHGYELRVGSVRGARFDPTPRAVVHERGTLYLGERISRLPRAGKKEEPMELKKELDELAQERMALRKRMEEIESSRREIERERSEFARRLSEFNKEISRGAKQKLELERMEAEVKRHLGEMDELRVVLRVLDDLLGNLDDGVVREFTKSDAYKMYERVMAHYLKEDEG